MACDGRNVPLQDGVLPRHLPTDGLEGDEVFNGPAVVSCESFEKTASGFQKLAHLLEPPGHRFGVEREVQVVITAQPLAESVQQPAVVLRIKHAGLCEMFTIRRVDAGVLSLTEVLLAQQSLGGVEHRVIRPAGCEFRVSSFHQRLGRMESTLRLFQEFPCLVFHAGRASSRTFKKNMV